MSRSELPSIPDLLSKSVNRRRLLQISGGLLATRVVDHQFQIEPEPFPPTSPTEIPPSPEYTNDAFIKEIEERVATHPGVIVEGKVMETQLSQANREILIRLNPNKVGQREATYTLVENEQRLVSGSVGPSYTNIFQEIAFDQLAEVVVEENFKTFPWMMFSKEHEPSKQPIDLRYSMEQLKIALAGNFDAGFDRLLQAHQPYEVGKLALDWYALRLSPSDPNIQQSLESKYRESLERVNRGYTRQSSSPNALHMNIHSSGRERSLSPTSFRNIALKAGQIVLQSTDLVKQLRSQLEHPTVKLTAEKGMELFDTHTEEEMQLPPALTSEV